MDAFLKSKGGSGLPKAPVSAPPSSKFIPWVEKYRPKTVDDVAHQEEVRIFHLNGSHLSVPVKQKK